MRIREAPGQRASVGYIDENPQAKRRVIGMVQRLLGTFPVQFGHARLGAVMGRSGIRHTLVA